MYMHLKRASNHHNGKKAIRSTMISSQREKRRDGKGKSSFDFITTMIHTKMSILYYKAWYEIRMTTVLGFFSSFLACGFRIR